MFTTFDPPFPLDGLTPIPDRNTSAASACKDATGIKARSAGQPSSASGRARQPHPDRVRGGKACQLRKEPARHYAAHLIRKLAPPEGFRDQRHVVHVILELLVEFIRQHSIALVPEEHLPRTVIRWIRDHPDVHAAFEETRAPKKD